MRFLSPIALFAVTTAVPAFGYGGTIQKCVDQLGDVTYQDSACERGSTAIAQIARDTRQADPAALAQAREEQERADRATERRARLALAEADLRSRQPLVVSGQPTFASEPYSSEPYYYYLGGASPGKSVRSHANVHGARGHPAPAPRIVGRPLSTLPSPPPRAR